MFQLVCIECGAVSSDGAQHWQAYLADLDDDGEEEVVCYCASCAAREFGRWRRGWRDEGRSDL